MTRIVPVALYQEVAERLRQRIFNHEILPGSWIDEQKIAEEYGISRTPMREALKVLAAEGLVELKPRRGCYVTEISRKDLEEVFSLLALLEGHATAEACRRATPLEIERLGEIHAELEKSAKENRLEEFFDSNQRFHRAILDVAGNRWLLSVIQDLRKVMKLSRLHSLSREGRIGQALNEHRKIIEAIKSGDPQSASRAMHDHLLSGLEAAAVTLSSKE